MLVSGELRCFLTMCLLTVVVYLLLRGHSVHCQPPGMRTIIASTSGSGDIEVIVSIINTGLHFFESALLTGDRVCGYFSHVLPMVPKLMHL